MEFQPGHDLGRGGVNSPGTSLVICLLYLILASNRLCHPSIPRLRKQGNSTTGRDLRLTIMIASSMRTSPSLPLKATSSAVDSRKRGTAFKFF